MSEQYIKMCDCEEIQWLKPVPSNDDRDKDYTSFFYLPDGESIDILKWDNDEDHPIIGGYHDDESGAIWLPRQDQLQEMLLVKSVVNPVADLLFRFDAYIQTKAWSLHYKCDYAKSFEQLWLGLFMKEKHGKTWDGENWVALCTVPV